MNPTREDPMKKIQLDLAGLTVESFSITDEVRPAGTVIAYVSTWHGCDSVISCRETCYFASCWDTDCGCVATEGSGCDMSYYAACNTAASCLADDSCLGGGATPNC
jgi:hypothetical protein